MTEAGWTREKPKGPGFYWYRATPDVFPRIANISRNAAHFTSGKCVGIDDLHGEWLGPITHTDRQQGRVEGLRKAVRVARDRAALLKPSLGLWLNMINKYRSDEADELADMLEQLAQAAQDEKGGRDGK